MSNMFERRVGAVGGRAIGGGIKALLFQLVLVVVFTCHIENSDAVHATAMCVQLGQANDNHFGHDSYHNQIRMGPWTIGARKFDIRYDYVDFLVDNAHQYLTRDKDRTCPYPFQDSKLIFAEPCVNQTTVELRTYAVKQDGKVMSGWLHFEFELKDPTDKIIAVYVQVRDEWFNAIGEFVSDKREQCSPTNSQLVQPTEYQILPCSAVGYREAKASNAVFMAEKSAFKKPDLEKYIPNQSISRGIHFTWRLSEYWCNRHLRFRPEAVIFTENMLRAGKIVKPLIYRKAARYWFKPRWFGTADIKLPKTILTCHEPVIDYSGNGQLKKTADGKLVAPWLHDEGVLEKLGDDYFIEDQWFEEETTKITTLKSCQWNTRKQKDTTIPTWDNRNTFAKDVGPTFAGRCPHHFKKDPNHTVLQGCNLNFTAPEFVDIIALYPNLEKYTDFVNDLTINRTSLCGVPCRLPTAANLTDIISFNDTSGEQQYLQVIIYKSGSRNDSKVEKLLTGRKYHAVLCIIWTMFLTPLGIYCARYFKETCMSLTCTGAHFWFWIHIVTAVAAAAIFISSLSGIWSNLETWGRNLNAGGVAHRSIGYLSVVFFFLILILGGLRPLERKKRMILMTAHSVLGFFIYFFNILAMVSSFYIPGSPTIGNCDEMGFSTKLSNAIFPIIVWILIDVGLHIAMTIMQLVKDKSVGLKRPWYCPIIPILPHDSADDFVGSSLRKITLLVYAGTAFIMTSTTIGLVMAGPENENCSNRTGELSCTEIWGCSASALAFGRKASRTETATGRYDDLIGIGT